MPNTPEACEVLDCPNAGPEAPALSAWPDPNGPHLCADHAAVATAADADRTLRPWIMASVIEGGPGAFVPSVGAVHRLMVAEGLDQDEAVRQLGGTP